MYKIVIYSEKKWLKDMSRIPTKDQSRILDALEVLIDEPWPENLQIKRLTNYPIADFRLRIGGYRVLLDRDEESKMVLLYRVLDRSRLY